VKRVALTGGIATGKSYVRRRLDAAGVPTIDADQLARDVVAPGTPGLEAVRARFGGGVIAVDGSLDRAALAAVIFGDAEARRALETIVHPAVRARTNDWLAAREREGATLAVADIPLLYETGRDQAFDEVIVVACAPATQLERLMSRDGLSEADARRRLAAQLPIEEKAARGTYVIRTDGTFANTDAQTSAVLSRLRVR
jgi:dephospho-CoA kinase